MCTNEHLLLTVLVNRKHEDHGDTNEHLGHHQADNELREYFQACTSL